MSVCIGLVKKTTTCEDILQFEVYVHFLRPNEMTVTTHTVWSNEFLVKD